MHVINDFTSIRYAWLVNSHGTSLVKVNFGVKSAKSWAIPNQRRNFFSEPVIIILLTAEYSKQKFHEKKFSQVTVADEIDWDQEEYKAIRLIQVNWLNLKILDK